MGKGAADKRFPAEVWTLSRKALAEFLRVLFSCDGTIYAMCGYPRIEFTVASPDLAADVQHALTRSGIVSKCWQKTRKSWRVEITEPASVEIYQREINWMGAKVDRFAPGSFAPRHSIRGHAPQKVWALVRAAAQRKGVSLTELARLSGERVPEEGYNPRTNRTLPLHRLRAYAKALDDGHLRRISSPDLYWDQIVEITPTGHHQVYDLTVPDGANFIAQDMCVHNTALTVQMAQYIALEEKLPVAIFSLEMSKEQLVTRMICSEAKVDGHRLRTGFLQDDDWVRVGNGIGRLAEAPIYIDDTPDISALEVRAKCRRLKAEQNGLGLIVIDYLQLMRSSKRTENRNQELSEIARACKTLARELKVPIVALSQLSRAVESRNDKRPLLSDLRECVTGDTRLMDARTGRLTPIREVKAGDQILGMGRGQKIGAYQVRDVWPTGVKPVWTLKTRTGRTVTATANHPFFTVAGWKCLEALCPHDLLATAVHIDEDMDPLLLLGSDPLWEEILSIEPAGEQEVFDIQVDCANFLANGIVAHNSGAIEAEADIVMFIYRDAYYKMKEAIDAEVEVQPLHQGEERVEEAEIIIAKQRNGPTGHVKVAFLPRYARFDELDLSHGDDYGE
jgi:replicative DNA helicase